VITVDVAKNKFTIILLAGALLLNVVFISKSAFASLAPFNPIYWTAAILQSGLAWMSFRLVVSFQSQRKGNSGLLGIILVLLSILIPWILSSNVTLLKPVGPTWLIFSAVWCFLALYKAAKDRNKEQDNAALNSEYLAKGFTLFFIVMGILFVILVIIIFGVMSCAN
jgi:hypothetical protein